MYSSVRTIWLLVRRRLGKIIVETWGKGFHWQNEIVRTRIWLDNIQFNSVQSSIVTATRTSLLHDFWKFALLSIIVPLQIELKSFFSGVLEGICHKLGYQILHGMISDFLGSLIQKEREKMKEEKKEKRSSIFWLSDSCSREARS